MLKSTIPHECFEGGIGPLQLNSHTAQKHLSGGQRRSGSLSEKEIVCPTVKSLCFSSPTVSHAVRRGFVPRDRLAPKGLF